MRNWRGREGVIEKRPVTSSSEERELREVRSGSSVSVLITWDHFRLEVDELPFVEEETLGVDTEDKRHNTIIHNIVQYYTNRYQFHLLVQILLLEIILVTVKTRGQI